MANEYREMKEDELKKENRQVEKREGGGIKKWNSKNFDMKMVQKSYKNTLEKNKKREKRRK